ncbi:hypothetical protein A9Q93_00285 [Nonlabens dokdonensis]|uniref:DUF2752 domain-containing protein n=1 Tax=Nonlabens dokdonensis TaxID=328515 RepID=A0A1Z8BGF8_9FLAO|nr:DUF2752 domain-containing protein [Nonlabens dokdonensis]OUS21664.1 hypothetical protein A9Q93_00285 [Nonlabens dokdonensis]
MNTLLVDDSWMLPCMSKQLMGMDCPGCGIQRSISFLLQGNIVDSFLMYPGLFPGIFLFVFLIVDWFKDFKHGEQIKLWATILTIGTIVSSYLIKMVIH